MPDAGQRYLPRKFGLRFSRKAITPSPKSCVANNSCCVTASCLSACSNVAVSWFCRIAAFDRAIDSGALRGQVRRKLLHGFLESFGRDKRGWPGPTSQHHRPARGNRSLPFPKPGPFPPVATA